jgi:hypothetical protein
LSRKCGTRARVIEMCLLTAFIKAVIHIKCVYKITINTLMGGTRLTSTQAVGEIGELVRKAYLMHTHTKKNDRAK